ncbi:MAG: 3-carboxyethylcatechol 2,3-dioxygenase [Rhizobium sp.]|nr:3-carboxyethylcatechol 2,3-dioxygenase [Rhizobium sp.]
MDRNRAAPDAEQRFWSAIEKAADYVAEADPDLVVVFHPDHVNGFFYKLLPSFCIGIEGVSLGDFGTVAGKLDIPENRALSCAEHTLKEGVDVAISYRIDVDHGGVQPIELLSAKVPLTRMIPIFVNCALAPRPTMARVRALGEAVGRWAALCPEKVLIVGSGGLSHDPPIASLATATPEVRQRLIDGGPLTHSSRTARQNNVLGEGPRYAAGQSKLLPLDTGWDKMLLDAFTACDLTALDASDDDTISHTGGRGGHEVRCWIAALAALGQGYSSEVLFYEPIPEWLTGMGIMTATPA